MEAAPYQKINGLVIIYDVLTKRPAQTSQLVKKASLTDMCVHSITESSVPFAP